MTEAWDKLRIPRARLSPSGAVPVAGPQTGPSTGEQFAALAVLAAIAAQQDAARQAASVSTRPQHRPRQSDGDQLAALLAEIETAQRKGSRPY
jgi:hypothetical protein